LANEDTLNLLLKYIKYILWLQPIEEHYYGLGHDGFDASHRTLVWILKDLNISPPDAGKAHMAAFYTGKLDTTDLIISVCTRNAVVLRTMPKLGSSPIYLVRRNQMFCMNLEPSQTDD
jgi:hypothetical protein